MERNEQHGEKTDKPQQGSGSAENMQRDRSEQGNQNAALNDDARREISQNSGIPKRDLTDLEDMGMNSGRDDYAGGSGDDMSGQSTGEETEKF